MHLLKQLQVLGAAACIAVAGCKSTAHNSKIKAADDDHMSGWTFLPANEDQRPIAITIDGQDDIVRYLGEGIGGIAYRRDSNGRILKVPFSAGPLASNVTAEREFFFDFPQKAAAHAGWSTFAQYIVKSEPATFMYQGQMSPLSIQKDFAAGKALTEMTDNERFEPKFIAAIKDFSDKLTTARDAGAGILDMSDDNLFYDAATGKVTVIDGIFKKELTNKLSTDRIYVTECVAARWCRETMSPERAAKAEAMVKGSPVFDASEAAAAANAADFPDAAGDSSGSLFGDRPPGAKSLFDTSKGAGGR